MTNEAIPITPASQAMPEEQRLPRRTLISYGVVAIPLVLAEIPVLTFLPAFYARERALSIGLVGAIFLIARIWDGFLDLVVGWLSDRTRSRFGRRKPWIVIGTPCLMLSAWFLCNPPADAGLGYMLVWVVLFYSAYTLVKIPYWSWGAELTPDYVQRSRVTSFREAGTMLGVLLFSITPMLVLADNPPLGSVLRLVSFGIILLLPLAVLAMTLCVVDPPRAATQTKAGFRDMLASVARNRPMILFLLASGFIYIGVGGCNAVIVFLIDIGMGLPGWIFVLTLTQYCAALAGTPLIARLGRGIDKYYLLAGGLLLQIGGFALAALLPLYSSLPFAMLLFAMIGLGSSTVLVIPLSIIADLSDLSTLTTHDGKLGGFVAAFNLTCKLFTALGLGLAFWTLDLLDFQPAAIAQSRDAAETLRLAGFGLTGAVLVPAVILLLRFPVSRAAQAAVRAQLQETQ